jgi:hypothetical protein
MDFIQLKEKFPGECMESHIARFMAEDVVDFTIQEEEAFLDFKNSGVHLRKLTFIKQEQNKDL